MTSSARDKFYGRRGGRWAEDWSDEDEARYQAAIAARQSDDSEDLDVAPSLFDTEAGDR